MLEYRKRRRAAQYAALEATSVSLDDEGDLDTVLEELRNARRVTAERRRGAASTIDAVAILRDLALPTD